MDEQYETHGANTKSNIGIESKQNNVTITKETEQNDNNNKTINRVT